MAELRVGLALTIDKGDAIRALGQFEGRVEDLFHAAKIRSHGNDLQDAFPGMAQNRATDLQVSMRRVRLASQSW